LALAAVPAAVSAMALESGLQRGAFSAAGSFRAMASAGASLGRRAPKTHPPQAAAMLTASLGLLGLIALRRLRARRAI
jgi:hypothetical protein